MARSRTLIALALCCAAYLAPAPAANAAPAPLGPEAKAIRDLTVTTLSAWHQLDSATDLRVYTAGVWKSGDSVCAPCNLGPAVAASALVARDPSPPAWAARSAIDAALTAVQTYQQPDGSFKEPNTQSVGISTIWFADEIGNIILNASSAMTTQERATLTSAVLRAVDRNIGTGDFAWYANGNLVVSHIEAAHLAFKLSGNAKYQALYEKTLAFLQNPAATNTRWQGRGLVITKAPTRADGADGAGYVTETGATTGYDPPYTMLAVDSLSRLYLTGRDSRILRLVNLLTNRMLVDVDKKTWTLEGQGSRHPATGRFPFTTAALVVLAAKGGRPELATDARAQAFTQIGPHFLGKLFNASYYDYREAGGELAPLLMAVTAG